MSVASRTFSGMALFEPVFALVDFLPNKNSSIALYTLVKKLPIPVIAVRILLGRSLNHSRTEVTIPVTNASNSDSTASLA